MKIVHVISSIDKGGAESHLYSLVSEQVKNKNNIKIIYFKGNSFWEDKLKKIGAEVINFKLKSNLNLFKLFLIFFKINFFFKKFKPDVVHAHLTLSEIIILFSRIFFNLKYKFIVTKHLDSFFFEGSNGQNKIIKGLFLEKILFNIADHVIFISLAVKKYFLRKIKRIKKNYSVIYYGINKNDDKVNPLLLKKLIKKYKINKEDFIILCIARATKQKRLDVLLEGFSLFTKQKKQSKLLLVSQGPELNSLKKLSEKLKIEKKIVWINYTSNINEHFKISNVFCLTSDYEGLGLVILEAFKMNVPVIASNKSAIKEIVKNNYSGLLFNNSKPANLSKCLEKIYFNKNFIRRITKNYKKILSDQFSINYENKKILKIYNGV